MEEYFPVAGTGLKTVNLTRADNICGTWRNTTAAAMRSKGILAGREGDQASFPAGPMVHKTAGVLCGQKEKL